MPSLFTRIIRGEIPSEKVSEDERFLAFMDIRPINPGHVLCVPKIEVDYLFDLEDEVLAGLTLFAKKVAKALKAAVDCERVGVLVAGFEIPHAHLHLVPISGDGELTFSRAQPADKDQLQKIAARIREKL